MTPIPEGIVLIDKPVGITSFDVIRQLRRELQIKKIGHAGTLDPLASGLMIVGVGAGTKLLHGCVGLTKEYEAEICIGESTETDDREGAIIAEMKIDSISEELLKETIAQMIGTYVLPVSVYSAMKSGGEAFYKKARRGEKVKPPQREMEVIRADYTSMRSTDNRVYVNVTFLVGSGTYIRSLAVELGRRLGYPARLENLRRTQVGDFSIKDARALK